MTLLHMLRHFSSSASPARGALPPRSEDGLVPDTIAGTAALRGRAVPAPFPFFTIYERDLAGATGTGRGNREICEIRETETAGLAARDLKEQEAGGGRAKSRLRLGHGGGVASGARMPGFSDARDPNGKGRCFESSTPWFHQRNLPCTALTRSEMVAGYFRPNWNWMVEPSFNEIR
jgi:hypothetical protein